MKGSLNENILMSDILILTKFITCTMRKLVYNKILIIYYTIT